MDKRRGLVLAGIIAGLLTVGIAFVIGTSVGGRVADGGVVGLDDGQTTNVSVADAGQLSLRLIDGQLEIVAGIPNPGYTIDIGIARGIAVEGDFVGNGEKVRFNAEFDSGIVQVRTESEAFSGPTTTTATTNPTSSTSAITTTTTASGSSPTSTTRPSSTTGSTSTTSANTGQIPNGAVTYEMGAAGSITVNFSGGSMSLVSINAAAGWTVDSSEVHSDEIEAELRNGELEAGIKVSIVGGNVHVELKP